MGRRRWRRREQASHVFGQRRPKHRSGSLRSAAWSACHSLSVTQDCIPMASKSCRTKYSNSVGVISMRSGRLSRPATASMPATNLYWVSSASKSPHGTDRFQVVGMIRDESVKFAKAGNGIEICQHKGSERVSFSANADQAGPDGLPRRCVRHVAPIGHPRHEQVPSLLTESTGFWRHRQISASSSARARPWS
jgi:hypothetical protein